MNYELLETIKNKNKICLISHIMPDADALASAFQFNMSEEELSAIGGNSSMNHVDFMVGTEDLTITGIKENGEEVVLFDKGDWSIT